MKRIIIAAASLAILVACGNNDSKTGTSSAESKPAETTQPAEATESADITSNPDYKKGLELIAASDCFTCHKVDEAYTGPTYREVANKYADQAPGIIPKLAEKIIKGGSGVWGQVPMLGHPGLSQADAEAMVKYVLLLKK